MQEIVPGIRHWTAYHEGIRMDVSSYYVESAAALIDPMVPPDGIERLPFSRTPERILLTNRHHYRHSDRYAQAFGCEVLCHEAGLHEFEESRQVNGFRFGDEVAPGVTALEVDAICDEETALHISSEAVAFGDGLVRWNGNLGFVLDGLMGDDPAAVKRGLRSAFRALLERDFDSLLFAHGAPLVGGGKRALAAFLDQG
jgi:glyoxylase-like metal-dependent hydrolase (beta-lactamase superfamily II)